MMKFSIHRKHLSLNNQNLQVKKNILMIVKTTLKYQAFRVNYFYIIIY